uniref:Uncharacterized protein n=1 Tax=Arundo donax TaxID=35708 RepID=A0A0A9D3D4_ARUDO
MLFLRFLMQGTHLAPVALTWKRWLRRLIQVNGLFYFSTR